MKEVKIYVENGEVILKDKEGQKYLLETENFNKTESVRATPFVWKAQDNKN